MPSDSINSEQASATARISVVAAMCLSPVKILAAVAVSAAPEQLAAPDTGKFQQFSRHMNTESRRAAR
jgi:hypothetical protein